MGEDVSSIFILYDEDLPSKPTETLICPYTSKVERFLETGKFQGLFCNSAFLAMFRTTSPQKYMIKVSSFG
jgi:hypothetical protein